jgi:metal-responsive CopG/Arc/MetJ family transcriptional regulator
MSKVLSLSLDDDVIEDIEKAMKVKEKTNRSEFIQGLIRKGIKVIEKEAESIGSK